MVFRHCRACLPFESFCSRIARNVSNVSAKVAVANRPCFCSARKSRPCRAPKPQLRGLLTVLVEPDVRPSPRSADRQSERPPFGVLFGHNKAQACAILVQSCLLSLDTRRSRSAKGAAYRLKPGQQCCRKSLRNRSFLSFPDKRRQKMARLV